MEKIKKNLKESLFLIENYNSLINSNILVRLIILFNNF